MKTPFIPIPNEIADLLPFLNLTERQWQVVWLVIRLSYGCQNRWAKIKLSDFKVVNITPSHIQEVIKPLLQNKVLVWSKQTKNYIRINEENLTSKFPKEVSLELEKLGELIGRNLKPKSYQNSNKDFTIKVNKRLPNEEIVISQKSNNQPLPNKEISASKEGGFSQVKDILNINIKSVIDNEVNADLKTYENINPHIFIPRSELQHSALAVWKKIEPGKPENFKFYLWAARKVRPSHKFFILASEVNQDKTIKNKGAVFVWKVMDYLKNHNLIK